MQHLPAHMIPTSWLFLDDFPLNSNGKIDRKQLPPLPLRTLQSNRKAAIQTSKNPNNLEDLLRQIYTSVLNVDIDEEQFHMSFIELGGTSLTAMTIVQLIRQRLFAEMEICLLFKNPSICALATALHSYQTHVQKIGKCT
jgi:acyl carrier protein